MPTRFVNRTSGLIGPAGTPNANSIRVNSDTDLLTFGTGASGTTEKVVVDQTSTQTLTNKTLTAPVIDGMAGVVASTVKFDATDGHDTAVGTSTGTIEIPAGAVLLDLQIVTTVLWDAGTSTTLLVGDDDDPNGWFAATNLQATDLVVGEVLSIKDDGTWGGVNGVYLTSAGRRGRVTAGVDSGPYYGAASEIVGVVTTVGTVPTVGTTYMTAFWTVPTQVAATYAAT